MKTKEEIQAIIDKIPQHRYGRVKLPHGLYTKGIDRTPTKDVIFPESLKGKSLLDVGCAFGYWCFEAEDLGAEKVWGIEIKKPRIQRAVMFKKLRESNVATFRNINISEHELKARFDYVLALNVLHHVPDPIKTLEFLGKRAKEKLIIESPVEFKDINIMEVIENTFDNVEFSPSDLTNKSKQERRIAICSMK